MSTFFGQKLPKSAKKRQKTVFLISTVRKLSSYDELWTVKLTWPNSATRFGRKSPKWYKSATRNGKNSPKWPKNAKNGEKGFTVHIANLAPNKSKQNFQVVLFHRSALTKGPLWYHWKVAWTILWCFIGKKLRLYRPNLLHKMRKWPRGCTHFLRVWELSLDLYWPCMI